MALLNSRRSALFLVVFQVVIAVFGLAYWLSLRQLAPLSQCLWNDWSESYECQSPWPLFWLGLSAQLAILPMYLAQLTNVRLGNWHVAVIITQWLWLLTVFSMELVTLALGSYRPQSVQTTVHTVTWLLIVTAALAILDHDLFAFQRFIAETQRTFYAPGTTGAAVPVGA